MPASRNARATIFTPRSWPSSPTLAMMTRMVSVLVFMGHLEERRNGAVLLPAVRRAILYVNIAAAGKLFALRSPDFAERPRGPASPDPARPDHRSGFDPCAGGDAAAGLDHHAVRDPGHDADEAVVVECAGPHLDVVADRHPCADDEIAARSARQQERVVLHVAALADDDAPVARVDDAAEVDARVIAKLDIARQDGGWRDVGASRTRRRFARRAARPVRHRR